MTPVTRPACAWELWLSDAVDALACAVLLGIVWLVLTPEGGELVRRMVQP